MRDTRLSCQKCGLVFPTALSRGAHEGWTGASSCSPHKMLARVNLVDAEHDPHGACVLEWVDRKTPLVVRLRVRLGTVVEAIDLERQLRAIESYLWLEGHRSAQRSA